MGPPAKVVGLQSAGLRLLRHCAVSDLLGGGNLLIVRNLSFARQRILQLRLSARCRFKSGGKTMNPRFSIAVTLLVLLRHESNRASAYAEISGKISRSFDMSNAAPLLGFYNL